MSWRDTGGPRVVRLAMRSHQHVRRVCAIYCERFDSQLTRWRGPWRRHEYQAVRDGHNFLQRKGKG